MKRLVAVLSLALTTLFIAPTAFAYTSPGAPVGYVNDFAKVLSVETEQSLENELTQFEATTSNEITVAIVPSMGGDYIENYAVKLFEEWKIGKKEKDNGVLLLLSIEERKMRIEVGYGLEGALPDSVAQSILNTEMTPRLKAGDYDGAVSAGVRAIEQATKGEYVASEPTSTSSNDYFFLFFVLPIFALQFLGSIFARSKSWWAGGIVGLLGGLGIGWIFALGILLTLPVVAILALLGLGFDYLVSRSYSQSKLLGVSPPWWAGGGRSGGGGFGGFGGGSSGGGGASGGW